MLPIARKMLHGATFVKDAMQLLINRPVLLIYPAVLALLLITTVFITFPYFKQLTFDGTYSTSHLFLLLVLPSIISAIQIFLLACMAHHAMHILQGEINSIPETIRGVARRFVQLLLWCIIILVYQRLAVTTVDISTVLSSLVLPIIATENTGVFTALKRICILVWQYAAVFSGAFIVLLSISIVQLLLMRIFGSPQVIATYTLDGLVGSLYVLTFTIFYFEYYARPRPELADIFTPDI